MTNRRALRALLAPIVAGRHRYPMLVVSLAFFGISETTAQPPVCCPKECVQDNNGCVTIGANRMTCSRISCDQPPISSNSGSSGSSGSPGVTPPYAPDPPCHPTQGAIDELTNNCVVALVGSSQLVGCLFEDDDGRAEDKRTDLTCADRQAALAKQCLSRCVTFAQFALNSCSVSDEKWRAAFGDIGGNVIGSARVKDCGPRLKTHLGMFSWVLRALKPFWP